MSVRTMNFNAIAASCPVNKQAALAHTNRGEHHDIPIPPGLAHFKTPPPPQKGRYQPTRAFHRDLTNEQVGRLRVVRFHGNTKAGRETWLVRCTCGDYELRRGQSLVNSTDPDECCYVCRQIERLKREASARSTPESRAAAAGRLETIAEGISAGILGMYVVCNDPKQKAKWNVRGPQGGHVFDPGLWDRWIAEQACKAINAQRGQDAED